MGWLIAVLGTGLALGGTIAIYFGAPYIQVEWGYSEVIAGTTALSAGILAVGLAAILFALRDLRRLATVGRHGSVSRIPAASGSEAVAPPPLAADPAVLHSVVGFPPPRTPASGPTEAPPREDEPALFRPTYGEEPVMDQAPTVAGRYEANGASYVLFSDGTIEVETETGTRRYASMQDLRAEIERQEAK